MKIISVPTSQLASMWSGELNFMDLQMFFYPHNDKKKKKKRFLKLNIHIQNDLSL